MNRQINTIIDFYNQIAKQYSDNTFAVDFTNIQECFCALLPEQGTILDFGCGSGRDTKYFLTQGYQLAIDQKYYNKLDIEGFSRMMKDPSYCYKFYWLEAIVQLISEGKDRATYDEIINEMIANVWYSEIV